MNPETVGCSLAQLPPPVCEEVELTPIEEEDSYSSEEEDEDEEEYFEYSEEDEDKAEGASPTPVLPLQKQFSALHTNKDPVKTMTHESLLADIEARMKTYIEEFCAKYE